MPYHLDVGEIAEQRELPPGTMLDDKYRIDELLAVGGMGAVYVGTHTKLRKKVAIKVLNPALSTPPMIERFHREAITASQIGHEGIAQVTDLGTSLQGEPFLVMELLEGESLAKRLKTYGALPIEVACELGCAILSPLDAAHRAGIIHRDLKPDNIFLVHQSRGEMVKLLDFGISRSVGMEGEFRLTTTGLVLGTPFYMSPEQARGDSSVSTAADIYAFGVILYEMLCGQVPITAENYNQLMYKVMIGEYVRPRAMRPDIPLGLEDLIARAMALAPQERPAGAAILEQQLLAFCRPTFREHTIEQISAQHPRATPFPSRNSGAALQHGTDQTVLARSATQPVATQPQPQAQARRSRAPLFAGIGLVVAAGVAFAIVMAQRDDKEPPSTKVSVTPTTPATTTTTTTATPTATPTPTATATATPAVAATITLRFAIEPAAATVEIDGKPAAAELVVPKDGVKHHLHVVAAGFAPHDEDLAYDESQRLAIHLDKLAAKPARPVRPNKPQTGKGERIETESPY